MTPVNFEDFSDDARLWAHSYSNFIIHARKQSFSSDIEPALIPKRKLIMTNLCASLQTTANLNLALAANISHFVQSMTANQERKQFDSFDQIALSRTIWADDKSRRLIKI